MILDILIGLAALAIALPLIIAVGVVSLLGILMVISALTKKKTK